MTPRCSSLLFAIALPCSAQLAPAEINAQAIASARGKLDAVSVRHDAARLDGARLEASPLSAREESTLRKAILVLRHGARDPDSLRFRAAVLSDTGQFCALVSGKNAHGATVTNAHAVNVDTGSVEGIDPINCAAADIDVTVNANLLLDRLR